MLNNPDILMCVGSEHYETAQRFIDEAATMGVSKRLPMKAPPQGLVPGVSRIFFRHERACAVFDTCPADDPVAQARARESFLAELRGLGDEVVEASFATWQKQRKNQYLHLDSWLYTTTTWHRAAVDEVFAKHQVRFAPGIFGYAYFGGFAWVTNEKPGAEVEIPVVLQELPGLRAIRVKREREESDNGQDNG